MTAGLPTIAVPVRNEVARLPFLLKALAGQVNAPRFRVAFFFDNCSDGSKALVDEAGAHLPFSVLTGVTHAGGPPNAGLARDRAARLAIDAAPDDVLLTTDADSEPAPDWIAANLRALARADVVAGRIVRATDLPCPVQDRVEGFYDRLYRVRRELDPVAWEEAPTHHWTSGASLAMPASVYLALGGFAHVPHGEDAALCDAAARTGYRVRRDGRVVVRTSARRRGRAPGGLATALAGIDTGSIVPTTSHPEDETWRYRLQAQARRLHVGGDYRALADRLALTCAEVEQVARASVNGEAFAARIVCEPPRGMRSVGLDEAERILSQLARVQPEAVG